MTRPCSVRLGRVVCTVVALFCLAGIALPARAQLETRITTPLLNAQYGALVVGDFNHDGKMDVVAVATDVQIFLGSGDGTFQTPIDYVVGEDPNSVAVADFNGDGNLDLAVTNVLSSTVSILLGNGDGTFQPPTTLNISTSPFGIAAADFNDDGKPDLIFQNDGFISVFLNNGDATFRGPN